MTKIEQIMAAAAANKYGDDSEIIGKLAGLFMSARFEEGYAPFICGTIGERAPGGLHEGYMICPSYGSDARSTQVFMRPSKQPSDPSRSIPADGPQPLTPRELIQQAPWRDIWKSIAQRASRR